MGKLKIKNPAAADFDDLLTAVMQKPQKFFQGNHPALRLSS